MPPVYHTHSLIGCGPNLSTGPGRSWLVSITLIFYTNPPGMALHLLYNAGPDPHMGIRAFLSRASIQPESNGDRVLDKRK